LPADQSLAPLEGTAVDVPAAPATLCFAAQWREHGRSPGAAQRHAGLARRKPGL
jgi:hypothetical protein